MALTPEETTLYTAYLKEAEKAYHQLNTGAVSVFVDQNGERVEYRAANRVGLLAYINQLRAALGLDMFLGQTFRPMGIIL
ncbi:MAG TPA: gpW family head-tail joining protein [Pyrinomonadaceae bacterium]